MIKMSQTWALPSRDLGSEGTTGIDGQGCEGVRRHRNVFLGGGGWHGSKEFPEEEPLELALGRALGGSRGRESVSACAKAGSPRGALITPLRFPNRRLMLFPQPPGEL